MTMRSLLAALLAATALAGAIGTPARAEPSSLTADAQLAHARQIVDLSQPRAALLQGNMRSWEISVARILELDPAMAKLEAEYPGVRKAAMEGGRQVAREYIEAMVDRIRAQRAAIIARSLSLAEMNEAIEFMRSGPGQRLIAGMIKNTDVDATAHREAAEAFQKGEMSISASDVRQVDREAAIKTASEIGTADQLSVLRFGQTSAAKKLAAAAAEADRETLQLVNAPDPKWTERQSEAFAAAVLKFTDRRGK